MPEEGGISPLTGRPRARLPDHPGLRAAAESLGVLPRRRRLINQPWTAEEDEFLLNLPDRFLNPPGSQRAGYPNARAIADQLNRTSNAVRDRRRVLLKKARR
jgi:hypothetical protein